MRNIAKEGRSERLNVRVTTAQAKLIRLAAEQTETNLSAFLVESACLRAEEALAAKQHLVYSPGQWDAFVAMLDRPTLDPKKDKPRLRKLLTESSVLEKR
jgi:uncharacterized protein (DUF1778 family)